MQFSSNDSVKLVQARALTELVKGLNESQRELIPNPSHGTQELKDRFEMTVHVIQNIDGISKILKSNKIEGYDFQDQSLFASTNLVRIIRYQCELVEKLLQPFNKEKAPQAVKDLCDMLTDAKRIIGESELNHLMAEAHRIGERASSATGAVKGLNAIVQDHLKALLTKGGELHSQFDKVKETVPFLKKHNPKNINTLISHLEKAKEKGYTEFNGKPVNERKDHPNSPLRCLHLST